MRRKMYMIALSLYLVTWVTAVAYKPLNFSDMMDGGAASPISLPLTGNVYPLGYYRVTMSIGNDNPPKTYVLDVDTGSDLTWARCSADYKGPLVKCGDDACLALGHLGDVNTVCRSPNDPCRYRIDYADGGSSKGVLVRDSIPLTLGNGTVVAPPLAFGCQLPIQPKDPIHQPITDGILGLGKGEPGILQQLSKMGWITRNIVSHCFNGTADGGGYLYLDNLPNFEAASWVQMSSNSEHYYLGSADILLDGEATDIRGLGIIFDSGSTYTYLASLYYEALLDLILRNLNGTLSVEDGDDALPMCWQGPFQTIDDAAGHFLPVALNFTNNVQFEMPPQSYLIISEMQNACLGILNGTQVGLGDMNLIGDISMQNKMVMYDNDNHAVGWADVEACVQQ